MSDASSPAVASLQPNAEWQARWEAAVRAHQRGDRAAARAGYDWILAREPGFAPGRFLSGVLARDSGDAALASAELDRALAQAPHYIDARIARARVALDAREPALAHSLALAGFSFATDDWRLWDVLGLAQLALGEGEAAVGAFDRAAAIGAAPASVHFNRGVALQTLGRFDDAAQAYRRAIEIDPGLVAAGYNLATALQSSSAFVEAAAAYRDVIARDRRNVNARKNLAEVLLAAGAIDAFIEEVRAFEAACPDSLTMAAQALEASQYRGDYAAVERILGNLRNGRYRASNEAELVDALETLLYLLLFFDVEPKQMLDLARVYDAAARRVYGEPLPRPPARRAGKLRIGYLSADFRDHVMGKMAYAAIEPHDRSRFELYFYSLSSEDDAWTARFRALADRFDSVATLAERRAAQRIAEDDLDILVDLSAHTKGAKPGILALKPARVQITHVASAGPVGLSAIDYKLTDRYADLPQDAEFQLEAPLVMDGCVYPCRALPSPAAPYARTKLGIGDEAIVIGAFVNPLKWSRRCVALWREVMERIPSARLAISPVAPAWIDVYHRIAGVAGIDRERIVVIPQGRDESENQARYAIVDFVLDPLPFGGVNGVLEPLAAGVPVVALAGRRHGERSAYSILANLGVLQTVAETARDYVDIATRLATKPAFAREVRAAIARGLESSPLVDRNAHTRALERAYIAALRARAEEALADAGPSRIGA